MRFGLLGCAAALTLIGTAAAQAETIYVENGYAEPASVDPGYVAAPSGYVAAPSDYIYADPAPRYVVTEPSPVIVSRPAAPVVVTEPVPTVIAEPTAPVEVVTRPLAAAPRERFVEPRGHFVERRVAPRSTGVVTTGYSANHSCFIDRNGFERCY
jgi:hypothetical protein